MGFDVAVFTEAAPGTGTPNIAAGLLDKRFKTDGDYITLKKEALYLLGLFYCAESAPGYAYLAQPNLREYQRPRTSISVDLNDLDALPGYKDFRARPMKMEPEKCEAFSNNASDEDTIIAAFLGSGKISKAMLDAVGRIDATIRGVADQTLTAVTWTGMTVTWTPQLGKGRYAVVGMRAASYTAGTFMLGVARLIFKEKGGDFRPGVLVRNAEGDKLQIMSNYPAPYEIWPKVKAFEFDYDNPPDVEMISPGANTDHVIELDLVKVG